MPSCLLTTSRVSAAFLILLASRLFVSTGDSQVTNVIDPFNPSGTDGFSYSGGQIDDVWTNWFGTAFQSVVWDPTMDANSNVNSGSMKITADFNGGENQFEVYDGFNGITPPLNGLLYTNFQCYVRFQAGSAAGTFNGQQCFGYLQFGISTSSFGQDYFNTAINIPATDTNWVQVNIPISAASDLNLYQINDILIHIYGPAYSPALSGTTTFWIDNIQFTGPTLANQCTVDWNSVFQRIDGFGASSAWSSSTTMTPSIAELYFSTNNNVPYTNTLGVVSTNNGAGFSLLRNHIYYANNTLATSVPSTTETSFMQLAQGYGARVWSTPWTPAAGFKSTNDIYDTGKATDGGLDGGSYLGNGNNITNINYASQLADYAYNMRDADGINLYAISIQNEPDADVTNYEACQWTPAQIHDFVTNLYNQLRLEAPKGATIPKIIVPEDESWQTNLFMNAMSDPAVAPDVGIVACHDYNNIPPNDIPAPFPTYANPNAATWETETAILSDSDDTSIPNALYWAGRIHLFMTVAQVNAWHYWWMVPGVGNLLDANSTPTKRLFAIGQFSRFVRPNYYRIGAGNGGTVQITAYKDTNSLNYAIVAINPNATNVTQVFTLTNFPSSSLVTPWITSSNLSLSPQSSVAVTNGVLSYTLPAMSIVTFAGTATNFAPSLTPVQNQTVNPGVTVTATNIASDVYAPPQTLTFNLLNAPSDASLNTSNGIFSWQPPVSAANTTNSIMVEVVNNGTPALSATNNFSVIVNPLSHPVISSTTVSGSHVNLVINGTQGPDYTIQTSTNLMTWQSVFTTNSPALPLDFAYTNSGGPALFFRVELGP
jgi:glucuronoarabinoxylan endo-1,4-beta-xylanase